jgi:3-deoxy-D-manno-octulosonic-acid transferase
VLRPVYSAAVRLLQALAEVAPPGESKFARALRARRGLLASYAEWGRRERDRSRPLLWLHAPSVGEALQAQPVLQLLRERNPEVQLAYTFFSPSAEPFAQRIPADFRAYLPFDHERDCAAAIAALAPTALIFSKADVWPNLVASADADGVAIGLISATVPEGSLRLTTAAVSLMRSTFASLDVAGAIDEGDAKRLITMGVDPARVAVTGDTRFDQVWERAARPPQEVVTRLMSDRPTLVAGSTWPTDEDVLLPAVWAVRRIHPEFRLVIAPHEVTPARVQGLRNAVRGARAGLLSEDATDSDVVIVDGYGLLGDLYRLADVAFVGGGFHRAGLHSVLEPAAFGAPALFGPFHRKSRDAYLLLRAGGAASASSRDGLTKALLEWLESDDRRTRAGSAARETVRAGLGAAERTYTVVAGLLELTGRARPR